MGLSRQEYWSGLPCPPPGAFLHPGIKPVSLLSPALADGFFTTSASWEVLPLAFACDVLGAFPSFLVPFYSQFSPTLLAWANLLDVI